MWLPTYVDHQAFRYQDLRASTWLTTLALIEPPQHRTGDTNTVSSSAPQFAFGFQAPVETIQSSPYCSRSAYVPTSLYLCPLLNRPDNGVDNRPCAHEAHCLLGGQPCYADLVLEGRLANSRFITIASLPLHPKPSNQVCKNCTSS